MQQQIRTDSSSVRERLSELAEILAAGLMRLQARKSSGKSAGSGESSLDCPAHRSGHPNPYDGGNRDD